MIAFIAKPHRFALTRDRELVGRARSVVMHRRGDFVKLEQIIDDYEAAVDLSRLPVLNRAECWYHRGIALGNRLRTIAGHA